MNGSSDPNFLQKKFELEYQAYIHDLDEELKGTDRATIDFAIGALKGCALLNGGGLLVIPAYVTSIHRMIDPSDVTNLAFAGGAFIVGLLLAWFAWVTGYAALGLYYHLIHEARQTTLNGMLQRCFPGAPQQYLPRNRLPILTRKVNDSGPIVLGWIGIIATLLSIIAFITGAVFSALVLLHT